jgi:acetylornithine deacetylase/succinyl-diaminopimelate desuccinylase-like protein
MGQDFVRQARDWADAHVDEEVALLRELGRIPAPTHHEQARACFCRDWLVSRGAEHVRVDPAGNVICEVGRDGGAIGADEGDLLAFAAHTDVVQPDLEPYPMREHDGRLYAPGIGDDTANLVGLLMATAFLLERRCDLGHGVLVVANSCEEGLGNLDGTKALFSTYEGRVSAFHSFDCYPPLVCCTAVGSQRYRVTCTTTGGHSYADFGRANAIEVLCGLVEGLYAIELPTSARTTMNVGRIEGGTTVNSIAQTASMLYEYRSTSQGCLETMHEAFEDAVQARRGDDRTIEVQTIGIRPGNGDVDPVALAALQSRCGDVVRATMGLEPTFAPASTDANVPLSLGIPACTMGTVAGGLAHTREEWIDLASLPAGLAAILALMLSYVERP